MLAFLLLLTLQTPVAGQPASYPLRGIVIDVSGAPVAGAHVRVVRAGRPGVEIESRVDGRFVVPVPAGDYVLHAVYPGFSETTEPVSVAADTASVPVWLVLQPAALTDTVTVTASRGARQLESPASTTVVTSAELLNLGASTVDDALRNTPGFSLFRRSSSRVANPTTQGVTLRGVSGSGASRTLVLADGVPLNDPFGSWVYWNRIPQAAIDRVEVVRGAAGDLYGADAVGGVIQILTFDPERPRLRAVLEGDSHDTARGSFFGGGRRGDWNGTISGEAQSTDGYVVVPDGERGPVDVAANSEYRTVRAALGYDAGRGWRASARVAAYSEDRGNGTPDQVNDTNRRQVGGEVHGTGGGGAWVGRVSGGTQSFDQSFSAVASDRASARLVRKQHTPSSFVTASGQFVRPVGVHAFMIGAEAKRNRGVVNEHRFFGGRAIGPNRFGGREIGGGVFGQVKLAASDRLTVVVGARGDFWKSDPRDPQDRSQSLGFFSPRISAAWRASPAVTVQAAAYRSFRTPTLNELHRGFRVGNIVTNSNKLLKPERLTGVEGGVLFGHRRGSVRFAGFWNRLSDAVANVTLNVTPNLITRQRQNARAVRSAGLEVEAELRPHPAVVITGLAVVTAARFKRTVQAAIDGNRIPQVPKYQFGAGFRYVNPRLVTVSVQLRLIGPQFEDDLNRFDLGRAKVVDLFASRSLGQGVHAFVSVENLFDDEFDVGFTSVRTVGLPRTVRAGVRLFLP